MHQWWTRGRAGGQAGGHHWNKRSAVCRRPASSPLSSVGEIRTCSIVAGFRCSSSSCRSARLRSVLSATPQWSPICAIVTQLIAASQADLHTGHMACACSCGDLRLFVGWQPKGTRCTLSACTDPMRSSASLAVPGHHLLRCRRGQRSLHFPVPAVHCNLELSHLLLQDTKLE